MGKWLEPKDFKCQSQAPDSLRSSSQLSTTHGLQGAWAEGGEAGGVATRNRLPGVRVACAQGFQLALQCPWLTELMLPTCVPQA